MTDQPTDADPTVPGDAEDTPADGLEPGADTAPQRQAPVILLLGAGEYGRDLVNAFQQFGASVVAADTYADAPAHAVADEAVVVELTDPELLSALIERLRPDYVVT